MDFQFYKNTLKELSDLLNNSYDSIDWMPKFHYLMTDLMAQYEDDFCYKEEDVK